MLYVLPKVESSNQSLVHVDDFVKDRVEFSTFTLNNDDILIKLKNSGFMIFSKQGDILALDSS